MIHMLHEFVPPFTQYLNIENAQNPSRKHFEKQTVVSFAWVSMRNWHLVTEVIFSKRSQYTHVVVEYQQSIQ